MAGKSTRPGLSEAVRAPARAKSPPKTEAVTASPERIAAGTHVQQGLRGGAGQAAGRAGQAAGVDPARAASRWSSSSRAATRPARAAPSSASRSSLNPRVGPRRGPARPDRAREDAVVLPALRAAPAGRRRDGPLRPQLVQPRRRRARDGLLHGGRSTRSSCAPARSSSGCWCAPGSSWSSTGSRSATRSRSGASSDRIERPDQALEAEPDGPRSHAPDGSSTRRPRTRCSRYTDIKQAPWYVVERRRQAARPAQRHQPPALAHRLRGPDPGTDRAAAARAGPRLRAPATGRADLHPGAVLTAEPASSAPHAATRAAARAAHPRRISCPGHARRTGAYSPASTSGHTSVTQPSGPRVMTRSPRAAASAISSDWSMRARNSAEPTVTSGASVPAS